MTPKQKSQITEMRRQGAQISDIADSLALPLGTVKTFLRRNPITAESYCQQCGKQIQQKEHRKEKRFCCDSCRMKWWNAHKDMVQQKAVYHFVCAACGKAFDSYGNVKRKYCCRDCYYAARKTEAAHD